MLLFWDYYNNRFQFEIFCTNCKKWRIILTEVSVASILEVLGFRFWTSIIIDQPLLFKSYRKLLNTALLFYTLYCAKSTVSNLLFQAYIFGAKICNHWWKSKRFNYWLVADVIYTPKKWLWIERICYAFEPSRIYFENMN